jgi:signal transduction histidine kinase
LRFDGSAWQPLELGAGYDTRVPRALAAAADGTIWLGYAGDEVLRLRAGKLQRYGRAQGLAVGNVGVITLAGDDVLVAGDDGVAQLRGTAFTTVTPADPRVLTGVSGLVRSAGGDLWLNCAGGVVHFAAAELERAGREPGYAPASRLYDYRDGLVGIALQEPSVPTALIDGAQRIWLITNQGLAWLDPAELATNPVAPTLLIDAVHAGGMRHAPTPGLRLAQGTTNIRVEYTATSLAVPDRVRFRHRLRGVDPHWQEAGARREANYTNLGPGDYTFQVIAANDDGLWNDTGATLQFSIAPRFFETVWFHLLVLLALAALAAALYLWRLRRMAERIRVRLEERTGERERIARELHDTLLQGVQGLLLRLQALSFAMADDDPRRATLDNAVDQARAMAVEGRDKIVALRGEIGTELPLSLVLRALGDELAAAHSTDFQLLLQGQELPLCPPVCEDVLEIAREALRNAFRHAQARQVTLELRYSRRLFSLRVRDDGRGLDEAVLRQGRREGHWGLVGMRERAERLGARLSLHRVAPQGTDVRLEVPNRVAFGYGARRWSTFGRGR